MKSNFNIRSLWKFWTYYFRNIYILTLSLTQSSICSALSIRFRVFSEGSDRHWSFIVTWIINLVKILWSFLKIIFLKMFNILNHINSYDKQLRTEFFFVKSTFWHLAELMLMNFIYDLLEKQSQLKNRKKAERWIWEVTKYW